MPKVARYAFIFLSLIFLLAATVVLAQRLAGDSDASFGVPCALMLVGLGIAGFAWYFDADSTEQAECSDSMRDSARESVRRLLVTATNVENQVIDISIVRMMLAIYFSYNVSLVLKSLRIVVRTIVWKSIDFQKKSKED